MTDEQVRQLEALDLVLSGRAGAGRDSLGAIVEAVRADRPPLRPEFAGELDSRLRAGFPREPDDSRSAVAGARTDRRARPRLGDRRRLDARRRLVVLGAAASVVIVVGVIVSGVGTASHTGPETGSPGGQTVTPASRSLASGAAGPSQAASEGAGPVGAVSGGATSSASASAPAAGGLPSSGAGRAVRRDASLSLVAPRGHVQQVADQVITATDRLGGIVESSNVAVEQTGGSQATLSLEVPAAALERALATLSGLARVGSRSESTLDITDRTGTARDRLTESRDERRVLLRQLARAVTPSQVASIRAQLGLAAGRIAQDEKGLRTLQGQARLAALEVTITEARKSAAGGGSGRSSWTPGRAVHDALRVLEAVFAVLVVGLAVLGPAGVLGALAWWAARVFRRRRRTGALAG